MSAPLARLVEIALRDVLDPGLGRSIVDLGLIDAVTAAPDGAVAIIMTTPTHGCPQAGFLKQAVAMAAGGVEGVTTVAVRLTCAPARSAAVIAAA